MLVLKVQYGQFSLAKLCDRYIGCTVTFENTGNTTLIKVDGLKVKLDVGAEREFVETCRIPSHVPTQHQGPTNSSAQHGGQASVQYRSPTNPSAQHRGQAPHVLVQQHRGQVPPQHRGQAHAQQHRGQAPPQHRGQVHAQHHRGQAPVQYPSNAECSWNKTEEGWDC